MFKNFLGGFRSDSRKNSKVAAQRPVLPRELWLTRSQGGKDGGNASKDDGDSTTSLISSDYFGSQFRHGEDGQNVLVDAEWVRMNESALSRPAIRAVCADKKGGSPREPPVKSADLFQFKYYKDHTPLKVEDHVMERIMNAILSPSSDSKRAAATQILIKVVMDIYCQTRGEESNELISLMFEMLDSTDEKARAHAFTFLFNLAVHANLYEENSLVRVDSRGISVGPPSATVNAIIDDIFCMLKEMLLYLFHNSERSQLVWKYGLKCLALFVIDRSEVDKERALAVDPRVILALAQHGCSPGDSTHRWLLRILVWHLYIDQEKDVREVKGKAPRGSLVDGLQESVLKKIGGVNVIIDHFLATKSLEVRRNMFTVLYDIATATIPEGQKEQVHLLLEMLLASDAPNVTQQLFKCYFKSEFVESVVKCIFVDKGSVQKRSGRSASTKNTLTHLDKSLVVKVLMNFEALAANYNLLEREFQEKLETMSTVGDMKGAHIRVLNALLHSDVPEDRFQGMLWLFELLKSKTSGKKMPDPHLLNTIDTIFPNLLLSPKSNTRKVYVQVAERLILFNKTKIKKDGSTAASEAMYKLINESLLRVVTAQEKNVNNLIMVFDVLFQLMTVVVDSPCNFFDGSCGSNMSSSNSSGHASGNGNIGTVKPGTSHPEQPHAPFPASITASAISSNDSTYRSFMFQRVAAAPYVIDQISIAIFAHVFRHLSAVDVNLQVSTTVSDVRTVLLVIIMYKCGDPVVFESVGGISFFKDLLEDKHPQISYLSSRFLLDQLQSSEPVLYSEYLKRLIGRAQDSEREDLLVNPYLQIRAISEFVG